MSEQLPPHPLDADDDDDDRQGRVRHHRPSASHGTAYQPLLQPSLKIAGMATVVLACASVLSAVFRYGSGAYNFSMGLFRISGAVVLVALVAVLIAYRIGYLRSPVAAHKSRLRQNRLPHRAVLGYGSGYFGFVLANGLGLILLWLALFFGSLSFSPMVGALLSPLPVILAGLLGTVIVTHRGYLRAYAIGCLVSLIMLSNHSSNVAVAMLMGAGGYGGYGGTGVWQTSGAFRLLAASYGMNISIAVVSGLICSGYIVAYEAAVRRRSDRAIEFNENSSDPWPASPQSADESD